MNVVVEIRANTLHRYNIHDVNSTEEAEAIAAESFEADDPADEIEVIDFEMDSFEDEQEAE